MNINMRRVMKAPTLRMMEGGEQPSAGAQMYGRASANLASMVDTSLGMAGVKPMSAPGAAPAAPQPTSRHDGMFSNPLAMPSMPVIGMKDGGEISPWSLRGMYNAATGPKESMTEKYARQDAARQPVPAPAPQPVPVKNISSYAGNAALDGRMKAAGLKNGGDLRTGLGGHVPGTGSGDKIDAKYEPGEFVVSNDMLDKAPGLRDMLHGLRAEALADKGMTPEQADAKAVSGPTLRAAEGYNLDQIPRDRGVPVNNPINSSELSRNVNNGLNALGGMGVVASVPLRGAQAVSGAASAGSRSMNAAPILTNGAPRLAAPAARAVPDFIAGAGEGATVVGRAASNLPAVIPGGSRALALTDNAANATKMTNVALQEGAQANSMAALTRTAANANAASTAGGNALSAALPSPAFVSQMPGAAATPTTSVTPVAPSSKAYQLRQGTLGENDNAYHGDLTGKINAAMKSGQTDLASTGMRANDIYKTKSANGTTSYSGYGDGTGRLGNLVSGDGTELRGRGSVSSVPGMSKELIAQTLRNPDGSAWSAADNARMAANLRDGADPYAGTSRMTEEAAPKRGEPGYNRYQATKTARDQNETLRRGQDMELEGKRASNESAKLRLQYDMGRDARKDLVDERKFQTDEANTQFDQVIKGNEAHYKKVLNSLPPINGKSGPEANTQAAAAYMTGAHAAVAARAAELRKAGNAAGAAALERQGTAGISATDHQNLLNGMEVMSRFKEIKGQWFTDGTKGNISNNPMDFVVVGPDPKNPKKVLLAGGQSMDMDDVTGTDTANRFGLPFWGGGQQTNQYLPK